MGQVNRKGQRSGKQASAHSQAQRRRREEGRQPAKRMTKREHHDGKVKDHKTRR